MFRPELYPKTYEEVRSAARFGSGTSRSYRVQAYRDAIQSQDGKLRTLSETEIGARNNLKADVSMLAATIRRRDATKFSARERAAEKSSARVP